VAGLKIALRMQAYLPLTGIPVVEKIGPGLIPKPPKQWK